MTPFFIQAFAAINAKGIYSRSRGYIPWNDEQMPGPADIQRSQVYDKPFTGFGKLNCTEKIAFGAAALALSEVPDYTGDSTGICLGTVFGCLSTDLRYAESVVAGFPSPAVFAATLPSSPVADIAILFKLKGPDRVIAGSACPGFFALENAMHILAADKADCMVVLLVSGLEAQDRHFPLVEAENRSSNYAYAFILRRNMQSQRSTYTLSLDFDTKTNKSLQNRSEESYFLEMVEAMMHNKNYDCSFKCNDTSGTLVLDSVGKLYTRLA